MLIETLYIKHVDGNPILKITKNQNTYELWWANHAQCMLGTFKTYQDALIAIYNYYGDENVIRLTESSGEMT